MDRGAELSRNPDGTNVGYDEMDLAAGQTFGETIPMLLEAGADVMFKDSVGRMPIILARETALEEAVAGK